MAAPSAHIAGVAISEKSDATLERLAISAATKALLDAGASFNDVQQSIAAIQDEKTRIPPSVFSIFGRTEGTTSVVDNESALSVAIQSIRSGASHCTLVVALDWIDQQPVAVGIVLVSDLFAHTHPYLKDSSIRISGSASANRPHSRNIGAPNDLRATRNVVKAALRQAGLQARDLQLIQAPQSSSQYVWRALGDTLSNAIQGPAGQTGLVALVRLVYQLRGWAQDQQLTSVQNSLQCTANQDGPVSVLILSRSDGKKGREWKDIEHVRDGRERLGYNPVSEERRGITHEDLAAVRARDEFTTDDLAKQIELPLKGGDRAALARL